MTDWKRTYLAGSDSTTYKFRVEDYYEKRAAENREAIAEAIHYRFKERYLDPLADTDRRRASARPDMHGFTMMAVGCLLIEALESFYQGLSSTKNKSQQMFRDFFRGRDTRFRVFHDHASDFYHGVRCGILHQAETRCGWRLRRTGPLLGLDSIRTINATRFVGELRKVLDAYRDELRGAAWNSERWTKARTRLDAICGACDPGSPCKPTNGTPATPKRPKGRRK